MTAKEKAVELVDKYIQCNGNSFFAKQCAIIAVDEILDSHTIFFSEPIPEAFAMLDEKQYWQQVKIEIENL